MWHRLGVPPFMTRAEVFKSAVQHTYSCRRAREQLGYVPLISSTAGMERVARTHARPTAEPDPEGRRRWSFWLLLAVALCAMAAAWCLVLRH
eukprot:3387694-Prymnesium_polylepis.2